MRCLIVDDEPLSREIIEKYCLDAGTLEVAGVCSNALEASQFLSENEVDLMFLDINMPKLTGIEFLKSLRNPPLVIFTTAYSEHAVEGFELEALDYLLKPFSFERFFQAIQRAQAANKSEAQSKFIFLKADKKSYKIDLSKIQHIEAMGDFLKVHIVDHKTLIVSETMKSMLKSLPANQFMRIHKSFIISTSHIDYVEANRICIGDELLPIGMAYREEVRTALGINKDK